jgi:glucose-6-phosphate 1-dehydrogenase
VQPEVTVDRTVQTPCGELAVERPARVADPATMVIFGVTGDLAKRKLLPALYNLNASGLLPERFAVIGRGREVMTTDHFRERVTRDLQQFGTVTTEGVRCEWLESRLTYLAGSFDDPAEYARLRDALAASALAELEERGGWRRVVVEKPFGHDLESARALNRTLGVLRRAPDLPDRPLPGEGDRPEHHGVPVRQRHLRADLEPALRRPRADHGRRDGGRRAARRLLRRAGALRDMVQNHLFQLIALTAMEPPISFDPDAVRDEREGAQSSHSAARRPRDVVAAQYGAGDSGRAYRDEPGVAADSRPRRSWR